MAAYDQSTADSTVLLLRSKSGFFQWLATVRLSRVIAVLLVALIVVPLVTHHYLSQVGGAATIPDVHRTRLKLEASTVDESELLGSLNAGELRLRVDELLRIRASVSNELRDLESKRQKYMAEIGLYNQKIEELKSDVGKYQQELERFKLSVEQAKYAQREALKKSTPDIWAPRRILPSLEDASTAFVESPARAQEIRCRMHSCFDHSRCSLTSGFPVYYYNPEDDGRPAEFGIEATLKTSVTYALSVNPHITFDPNIACVFVVLLGSGSGDSDNNDADPHHDHGEDKDKTNQKKARLESYLYSLAHWHGDGRNHVILHVDDGGGGGGGSSSLTDVKKGRAMVAKTRFDDRHFRPAFDVVMPSIGISSQPSFQNGEVWREMPAYSPARRHFLMTFQGELRSAYPSETVIVDSLKAIQRNGAEVTEDKFQFDFSCDQLVKKTCGVATAAAASEWCVCGNTSTRARLLQNSTFSLILAPVDLSVSSTDLLNLRLREALRHGAVPVLLGDSVRFPYDEYVQWSRATIVVPKARITELHFLLRTVSDGDLFAARHQGRLLYERYLSTTQSVIDTFVSVLRTRLGIGPPPARDEPSPSVFNGSFVPLRLDVPMPDIDPDESPVGPVEPPHPSPTFRRNFTAVLLNSYDMWNRRLDPFQAYPFSPHDPLLPSEAKFIGSALGFRPIGDGAGGAGKEFSEALGGNVPREQFTIVMLTYEREAILINSLQRLYGLPHLNKVIVVWNSPRSPSEDLRWPDIGIPIHVIRAKKNSLNNRFLPYDAIETEAVLSVDDDAHLRHDEIMFGFRVWREARDRIVGFPGRYHAWDTKHGGWLYNSNYSCELSMVLTGAAFFHKYYSYLYSNTMPQAIRDKVDEYMNCEDIAMNFLVSHLTRKPPLKVTSRWTFRCPGCPVALSEDDTHFHERHRCINFFVDVYGYMPLLNTQFRVDSVLFKTRLPHDKQKCFKFI